jgi:hypothetical protein
MLCLSAVNPKSHTICEILPPQMREKIQTDSEEWNCIETVKIMVKKV